MAKNREKRRINSQRILDDNKVVPFKKKKFEVERKPPPIIALNPTQARYLACLRAHPQVLALGPAGTGKTWIAATYAADLYRSRAISRIILTRPNVPCGRSLGFFPGSLENKFAPWAVPVTDAIRDRLGPAVYDVAIKNGDIEVVPFEVMRGRSWSNAFVLLDEAQNTTPMQMKMFLTRIGEGSKMVVTGDPTQVDLPTGKDSGLLEAISILEGIDDIAQIAFTGRDVVRRELVGKIVDAYEAAPRRGERHG